MGKFGRKPVHGLSGTPEYWAWSAMRKHSRPGSDIYESEDSVCAEWREKPGGFLKFLAHVGKRPSYEFVLNRIDITHPFGPGNVQWVTKLEQRNNRNGNVQLEVDGQTLTVAQWSRIVGISANLIDRRLANGWTPKRALSVPASRTGVRLPISPCLHGHGPCQCPCGFEKPKKAKLSKGK
jgi:hypothetical protein